MSSDLIKNVTDATFDDEVIKSGLPVLVDYWAVWCGPCKQISPILDELAVAYKDRVSIVKMNVDENRVIPSKYGIRGIPTLMIFKSGALVATKVGAVTKAQLSTFIDSNL